MSSFKNKLLKERVYMFKIFCNEFAYFRDSLIPCSSMNFLESGFLYANGEKTVQF